MKKLEIKKGYWKLTFSSNPFSTSVRKEKKGRRKNRRKWRRRKHKRNKGNRMLFTNVKVKEALGTWKWE
jgi:ribosomal protein L21